MKTDEVFGMSAKVRDHSYVDRGSLDAKLKKLIDRQQTHIAISGASKAGKSWLRQRVLSNPIVVQCRLGHKPVDIYREALARLGVRLEVESTAGSTFKGKVTANAEAGINILAKVRGGVEGTVESQSQTKEKAIGNDIDDLGYIAEILKTSKQVLVVEDFHYLEIEHQRHFAHDLKALWDYNLFVVVVGVWTGENTLISLDDNLAGRIEEISVSWSPGELKEVFEKGCSALGLKPSNDVSSKIASISYGSAGLIQVLALRYLDDELGITESANFLTRKYVVDLDAIDSAAMHVAEQMNQLYQTFAKRVSNGIRKRPNSTGIYAHAMAAAMAANDDALMNGLHVKDIHAVAHKREERIQLGNLRSALDHFAELQIDAQGRGLVLAYDGYSEILSLVDRQLLLYRKYATVKWPWEELIEEVNTKNEAFS